ncbi:hypothetical protein B0T21DRAFT_368191 [Apiosordaria backusii]|uniref:Uncharacterized protein n=1 Tax=Apiosordaria backusii TaxID=314023 RepID=A0AA40BJY9_9PEZI|nr:hypothetical protein B0T21DRAFT_368191 [Apiosordaria backusii]
MDAATSRCWSCQLLFVAFERIMRGGRRDMEMGLGVWCDGGKRMESGYGEVSKIRRLFVPSLPSFLPSAVCFLSSYHGIHRRALSVPYPLLSSSATAPSPIAVAYPLHPLCWVILLMGFGSIEM